MGDGTRPGDLSLPDDIAAVVHDLERDAGLSVESVARLVDLANRFAVFSSRCGVGSLAEVSTGLVGEFVSAPTTDGAEPSVSTMHLRRSVVRLVCRLARRRGLVDGDPSVDVVLPPRSSLRARPLTDDEVLVCRSASLASLSETRLPAAWALAEATARSGELARIRYCDVDLDTGAVALPGSRGVSPRVGYLTEWGLTHIQRRFDVLTLLAPDTPLVYRGTGDTAAQQAASCVALGDVLRRAGLAAEPDVRPVSITAWAGRQILAETGRIEDVARRLGMASLDRTAALIGWDWNQD